LIEFQKGIYHSFAAAKYGVPNKRLTDEEKEALEFSVKVKEGSSDYNIDLQALAVEFVKQMGSKMNPTDVLILVLGFAVVYFGTSSLKTYLEGRKEVRLKEISDETQRKTLEALEFQGKAETERAKILADALTAQPRLINISSIAHDAQTDLVRSVGQAEEAQIDGFAMSGKAALALVKNARRQSEEVRLDGIYRLMKFDWSDPLKFKVKVWSLETGELDAEVQDASMTGQNRLVLQNAEWERQPVKLQINARKLDDSYRNVVIVTAEAMPTNESRKGSDELPSA
jgi:hypothetical protein